jgi:hypothetical protein
MLRQHTIATTTTTCRWLHPLDASYARQPFLLLLMYLQRVILLWHRRRLLLLLLLLLCFVTVYTCVYAHQQLCCIVQHAALLWFVCALLQGAGCLWMEQLGTGTKVVVSLNLHA